MKKGTEKKEGTKPIEKKEIICKGVVRLGSNEDGSPKVKGDLGEKITVTPEQERSLKNKKLI